MGLGGSGGTGAGTTRCSLARGRFESLAEALDRCALGCNRDRSNIHRSSVNYGRNLNGSSDAGARLSRGNCGHEFSFTKFGSAGDSQFEGQSLKLGHAKGTQAGKIRASGAEVDISHEGGSFPLPNKNSGQEMYAATNALRVIQSDKWRGLV